MALIIPSRTTTKKSSLIIPERGVKFEAPKNNIASLPEHLGGGEYKTSGPGSLIKTPRSQNVLATKSGSERDHIISVALGGTSNKENLQYLKTTEEGRQEGKVSVEQKAINDYLNGTISLPQARAKIANKQQLIKGLIPPQGTKANLKAGIEQASKGFIKGLINLPKDYFKESFLPAIDLAFRTSRAGTQLASTPVAYGIDKVQGGDTTFSELANENFEMAKSMIKGDTRWGENVSKAAQLYLKKREVKTMDDVQLKDIGVLTALGFFNIFGDPFLEATAINRLVRGTKEAVLWKKVGQIKKKLPTGTIIKRPNVVEIPIAKNLKIKVKPFKSEIVIEGFARRNWKPEILAPNKLVGTTDDAIRDLVKIIENQSGAKVTGVIKGQDLILQPTLKTQIIASQAGFAKVPNIKDVFGPKEELIIPEKVEPLSQEAKKFNTADEFVNSQQKVYHGTSAENASKISQEGFKIGAGKGVSSQVSTDFVYATGNKPSASKYVSDRLGIKNPTVIEVNFSGKTLEIQGKMADFEAFGEASKKLGVPLGIGSQGKPTMLDIPAIQKAMREQGYSAIGFSDRYANGSKALAILPGQIKTKSQLTDIYKKANNIVK